MTCVYNNAFSATCVVRVYRSTYEIYVVRRGGCRKTDYIHRVRRGGAAAAVAAMTVMMMIQSRPRLIMAFRPERTMSRV